MKYPTQYEAEAVLEINDMLQNAYTAGVPTDAGIITVLTTARNDANKEYQKIFNSPETSPWKVEIKRKKRVVSWDHTSEASAKILGDKKRA